MNLRIKFTGLSALVTDRELVVSPVTPFTRTTSRAWVLLVGPRATPHNGNGGHGGHDGHGAGGHAAIHGPGHEPGLLVDFSDLDRTRTSNPDRMFDDPAGRHLAWWSLRDRTLRMPDPGTGPLELTTDIRPTAEICVRDERAWRDVTSIGQLQRAYPDAALNPDCLVASPPLDVPVVGRFYATGGRIEATAPPPESWPRKNHWAFENGFARALCEGFQYTAAFPTPEVVLTLQPHDDSLPALRIAFTESTALDVTETVVAISNLSNDLSLSPALISAHMSLYYGLFSTSASREAPRQRQCDGNPPLVTFPDSCPPMWIQHDIGA
jgi:hypothetical protein